MLLGLELLGDYLLISVTHRTLLPVFPLSYLAPPYPNSSITTFSSPLLFHPHLPPHTLLRILFSSSSLFSYHIIKGIFKLVKRVKVV